MFLYIEYKGTNPRVAPVTLHISIIIRLWNGIFGIRENAKYLDWKRDLTTTRTAGKQDSSKFRYRMGDFLPFCLELEDLTATREAESGIHQNLGTGCGIFFACLSGIREDVRSSGNYNCESNRRKFSDVSYPILSPSSIFVRFFPPLQYTEGMKGYFVFAMALKHA